jgi:hypothetical protein
MVALPETFAPSDVPADDRNFEPIPVGNYKVQVIESKIEATSKGTGQMLVLTLEILDGPFANRRLWDRLNVRNDSPVAQVIAQRALADLCLQIGVAQLRDSDELHFKPFTVKVGIQHPTQKDKEAGYDQPKNTMRYNVAAGTLQGAAKVPTAAAPPRQAPQQGRPAPQAAKGAAKPWNQPKQAAKAQLAEDDEIPF